MILRDALVRARHGILLAALLCILLARTAVPAGWMPMASAGGGVVLAPCSGMGAMTVAAHAEPGVASDMAPHMSMAGMAHAAPDDSGKDGKHHPDPGGDHPCSGAGVSVALDSVVICLPAALVMRPFAPPTPVLVARVGEGLAAPPPPQTGPPILV